MNKRTKFQTNSNAEFPKLVSQPSI